jgi:ABC-2 type transport system ATP-binding protein
VSPTRPGSARRRRPWQRPVRLAAEGLAVAFDGTTVLAGTDLQVRAGRCLAVVGHNGAGKSTLLRVLAGELPATAGTVAIDGVPHGPDELRTSAQVAASVDDPSTAPPAGAAGAEPASVRERVTTAVHRRGGHGSAADEVLADLGLSDHTAARTDQLSSGLRQRAQLACALVAGADVVLLDDPTAFLDARTAVQVAERVATALRGGAAVVLATHDHDLVGALADEMLVLEDGRVVSRGRPRAR